MFYIEKKWSFKSLKWQVFYLLRFLIGTRVSSKKKKAKKNTVWSLPVAREVLFVAPPTLICLSDKRLQVKSLGKDIFGASATGFLYASVLSDLAYLFLRFPIS